MDSVYIQLFDTDLIKQFMSKETLTTIKDMSVFGTLSPMMLNGLVFTEGEHWKRQRKLLSQVFHFDYMNNSIPSICEATRKWIDRNCQSSSSVIDVSKEFKMYTSAVLWRIFFGEESFAENQNAAEIIEAILGNVSTSISQALSIWNFLIGPKFFKLGLRLVDRQHQRQSVIVKNAIYSKLEKLKANMTDKSKVKQDFTTTITTTTNTAASAKNLIELLLEQAEGLSDMEITAQIFTFFVVGTDTTSELLAISQYLLATHPEVQSKLREEVLAHIGKIETIKYEHFAKMEYLNAVIKEALRFGGPTPGLLGRVATQDFILGDLKVKKGMVINPQFLGAGHSPRYFKRPEQFIPERWIEKSDLGAIDSSIFLPFSAGSRKCIGEQLALIESKIILSELVRQFNIGIKTPYELRMGFGLVYHATTPINAIYTRIEKA